MKNSSLLQYPVLMLVTCFLAAGSAGAQQTSPRAVIDRLEKNIPVLMKDNYIPALTAAYIHKGVPVWSGNFGVMNVNTKTPVTDSTLFEAASLTKAVTAYAAMKLVDEGRLHLDTPLNVYLGNNYEIGNDPRIGLITARRVLSHTAGFPNWRNEGDSLLPVNFDPGKRFEYSGEGFVYLARVMEKITGLPFDKLLQQMVFAPLGMPHSSMAFQPVLKHLHAYRHNWLGQVSRLPDFTNINAAASLRTTAKDYAVFLAAVLNGKDLKKASHQQMLTTQIKVDTATPHLAWGLGIGLEETPGARYCWHWGDQGDSKALFVANIDTRDAVLYFTNSANGLAIAGDMMGLALEGKQRDILAWVAYGEFDPAAVKLVEAIKSKGAAAALEDYRRERKQPIGEEVVNNIGYLFLREKNIPAALAVFTQNTEDHPASFNVWDSLAEAYMNKGDNATAVRYYEKSLVLNPQNQNATNQLKNLKKP